MKKGPETVRRQPNARKKGARRTKNGVMNGILQKHKVLHRNSTRRNKKRLKRKPQKQTVTTRWRRRRESQEAEERKRNRRRCCSTQKTELLGTRKAKKELTKRRRRRPLFPRVPDPPVSVQYISNPSFTRPVSRLHPGPRPAHLRRACPVGTCVFTAGTRHRQGGGEGKPEETGVGVGAVVKTWVFTSYVFTLRTISAPPPFTQYIQLLCILFTFTATGFLTRALSPRRFWVSTAPGQPKQIVAKFFFIYPYFYSKCIYCICRNIFPHDSKHMNLKNLLLLSKIQGFF